MFRSTATGSRLVGNIGAGVRLQCIAPQQVIQTKELHTTTPLSHRWPALLKPISKRSWKRNLKKIEELKTRLGDKYKSWGREKRRSPRTDRVRASTPSQPPKPPPKVPQIAPLLAKLGSPMPYPIVPNNLAETLKLVKELKEKEEQTASSSNAESRSDDISQMSVRKVEEKVKTDSSTVLRVPPGSIPPVVPRPLPSKASDLPSHITSGIPSALAQGPYYAYGVTAEEIRFLLEDAPRAEQMNPDRRQTSVDPEEQAEMVRRILSLENAGSKELGKFNRRRMVELFGRSIDDGGSAEVQATLITLRIQAIMDQAARTKLTGEDKQTIERLSGKRRRHLKYLRRTDLAKFVETCHAIGVDPDEIHVRNK
ncbi:hypothetical protein HK104_004698 [Borealophlyctis nickersoniae]|nr:hypothetical protein HK104_004698 [Borealophlyctis nickersoniae]